MRTSRPVSRSVLRVALGVALILSLEGVAMLVTDAVRWTVGDFVLAGVMLTVLGVVLELAARRAGNLLLAGGVATLGVASAVVGEMDDAPGLVLVGLLLVAGAAAVAFRRMRRPTAESG